MSKSAKDKRVSFAREGCNAECPGGSHELVERIRDGLNAMRGNDDPELLALEQTIAELNSAPTIPAASERDLELDSERNNDEAE